MENHNNKMHSAGKASPALIGAGAPPRGRLLLDPHPAGRGAAPPANRGWSPEEWVNRQREAIETLGRAAGTTTAEETRSRTLGVLQENVRAVEEISREVEQGNAERVQMRALIDQQTALIRLFQEQTEAVVAERARGGGPARFRVLPHERAGWEMLGDMVRVNPDLTHHFQAVSEGAVRTFERLHRDILSKRDEKNNSPAVAGLAQRDLLGTPGSAGSGAVFSQNERTMQIIGTVTKYTTAGAECQFIPQPTADMDLFTRNTRARAYRVARNAKGTASEPGEPNKVTPRLQEYIGLGYLHYALLADANLVPTIIDLWLEDMVDSIAQLLESDITIGVAGSAQTGLGYTPGNFWFTGFLQNSSVPTLRIKQGQRFDSVSFDDVLGLASALPTKFGNGFGKLHFHRSVLYSFLNLKDAAGRYLFVPGTGDLPPTVGGYPFALWETMPRTSQAGSQANTAFAAFGDLRRAWRIGVGQQPQLLRSEHAKWEDRLVGYMLVARYSTGAVETDAIVNLLTNP